MDNGEWVSVPVGIDAERWITCGTSRTVLVAAHTLVSLQRLLDVVGLVEDDRRIQVIYTSAPDVFHRGVKEFLHDIGAFEISWRQATHERFDLALAAAYGGIADLRAPVMVLPHGAGYGKRTLRHPAGRPTERGTYGLDAESLVHDGRVVPAAVVLSHEAQRATLSRSCPEAAEVAVVAGDPCYDRLSASCDQRAVYREALDVGRDRRLVVVTSTWGRQSLFGRSADLLSRLVHELDPRRYQVAALIHPAIWFGHGRRQVRAWLAAECAAGLILVGPECDWRAAIIAADCVIGDHGSVTVYAAAIGRPTLHSGSAANDLDGSSPQAFLDARAPRLRDTDALAAQLNAAAPPPDWAGQVRRRLTSRPGEAHHLLRGEMYRLLDLLMPGRHRAVDVVPAPASGGVRHA